MAAASNVTLIEVDLRAWAWEEVFADALRNQPANVLPRGLVILFNGGQRKHVRGRIAGHYDLRADENINATAEVSTLREIHTCFHLYASEIIGFRARWDWSRLTTRRVRPWFHSSYLARKYD